jgi:hypothetical protein
VSDAEVAETSYTAFTSRGPGRSVTARLIVRRVKLLPPAGGDQPALIQGYRYHAVFTDFPLTMLQAETLPPRPRHRRTGHRRPEERAAGSPAVREVRSQRRLAHPGGCARADSSERRNAGDL